MDILKRAFLFLLRKRKKSLILFILFTLITSFITISFSVFSATQTATASLRETIGASFTLRGNVAADLDINTDGASFDTQFIPISQQTIHEITGNPEIKAYNAQQSASAYASGFYFPSGQPYGTISANTATAWNQNFANGTLTLAEGRHIEKDDHMVALVSRELAEENNFRIGDRFSLSDLEESPGNTVTIEIIGIYESDAAMEFNTNTIITDHDTFWKLTGNADAIYFGRADFFVKDPERLEEVIRHIIHDCSVSWDDFSLQADAEDYDAISYQLLSISRLSLILIISAIIVSAIILLLILAMRVRNRIHEIGILLAVGVSKGNIVLQFFVEAFAVLLLAILISCPVGYFAAAQIGASLRELIGTISVSVSANRLLLQYTIEIAIVLIGIAIAAYPLIRLKPKDILSKMS